MSQSVLERAGGFARVHHVVAAFYDRVLDCPALHGHFTGMDMARLVDHQTKLVAGLMSGDHAVDDALLQRVHARLSISASEFDILLGLLHDTMEDLAHDPRDIEAVCGAFARRRHLVVAA